jgi:hypothetical protein
MDVKVRELTEDLAGKRDFRFRVDAIECLQEVSACSVLFCSTDKFSGCRSAFGPSVRERQPVRHSRQARDHHAAGHSTGSSHHRRVNRLSSISYRLYSQGAKFCSKIVSCPRYSSCSYSLRCTTFNTTTLCVVPQSQCHSHISLRVLFVVFKYVYDYVMKDDNALSGFVYILHCEALLTAVVYLVITPTKYTADFGRS